MHGLALLSAGVGSALEIGVVPLGQRSFGYPQERSRIGQVAGAHPLGGAFEKAFRRMRTFRQKRDGGSEALPTAETLELRDAHVELDGIVAEGQVLDVFAG